MIPLDNCFIKCFNQFIIFLQVFASLAYLYLAAFRMEINNERTKPEIDYQAIVLYTVEAFFLLDVLLKFFKEYVPNDSSNPVNSFACIVDHYITGDRNQIVGQFIFDAIPLLPLQLLRLKNNRQQLFYLIKFSRFAGGVSNYDRRNIKQWIKGI